MAAESGDASAALEEASAWVESGQYEQAITALIKAMELSTHNARLHEALAQCLMEVDDDAAAEVAAKEAVKEDPKWAPGWQTHARACLNMGRLDEAICSFSRCLELEPANEEVAVELREAHELGVQQVAALVGLPGLRLQQRAGGEFGPGVKIWDCGILLASQLVDGSIHVGQASVVLELGSGTGIVGITAATVGARVMLTDVPAVMESLQANIEANKELWEGQGGTASCWVLDWTCPEAAVWSRLPKLDLVLGADLVYSPSQILPLSQVLQQIRACHPLCTVVLAHKSRQPEVDVQLWQSLKAADLQFEKLPVPEHAGRVLAGTRSNGPAISIYCCHGHASSSMP